MTGRTHLAVGVAAALLAAGPAAGLTGLAVAAAGGAVGAVLPDLDVRDTAHPWRERLTRAGAAALLAGALVADAAAGWPLVGRAAETGLESVALGLAGLVALCCAARLSAHRSFSHSLLALAGFAAATHLVCAPLAPYVALGLGHAPRARPAHLPGAAPPLARAARPQPRPLPHGRRRGRVLPRRGARHSRGLALAGPPLASPPRGCRARGRGSAPRRRPRASSGTGTGRRAPRPTSPSRA